MIKAFKRSREFYFVRGMTWFILSAFLCNLFIFPSKGFAQNLPVPGTMVSLSPAFTPALISGMTVHPENPLQFDFIINTGDDKLQGDLLKKESTKLINYFMATLTIPENEMWVNLSPYEKNRIIADGLSKTEMGRDMLAQDYLLKQLTASLLYPEGETGKAFWQKVYAKAREKFGNVEVPTDTFNKVWIIPQEASVYVHDKNVFVMNSHLKVMLEQDYLAIQKNNVGAGSPGPFKGGEHSPLQDTNAIGSQIIREIVIPEIEKEVNEGKNFSDLRQIFNSMILATWYKKRLKNSLFDKIYLDKNKIRGIDLADKDAKEKIYAQYLAAFKKGVYNYIKEDIDPSTQDTVAHKYFSGGVRGVAKVDEVSRPSEAWIKDQEKQAQVRANVTLGVSTTQPILVGSSAVITEIQSLVLHDIKELDETNWEGYSFTFEDERMPENASGRVKASTHLLRRPDGLYIHLHLFNESAFQNKKSYYPNGIIVKIDILKDGEVKLSDPWMESIPSSKGFIRLSEMPGYTSEWNDRILALAQDSVEKRVQELISHIQATEDRKIIHVWGEDTLIPHAQATGQMITMSERMRLHQVFHHGESWGGIIPREYYWRGDFSKSYSYEDGKIVEVSLPENMADIPTSFGLQVKAEKTDAGFNLTLIRDHKEELFRFSVALKLNGTEREVANATALALMGYVLGDTNELQAKVNDSSEMAKEISAALLIIQSPESILARGSASSSIENPGGIDLNAKNLNLKEQGKSTDFDFNFDNFPSLDPNQVNGLSPVINNIVPITSFRLLLGLSPDSEKVNPAIL